jgi:Raf kinase inhibitor-like YbhB/YbcL family protein
MPLAHATVMRILTSLAFVAAAGAAARAQRMQPKPIDVSSPEIAGTIPAQFTCDGKELSPPLTWSNVPAGTKSIAIVVEDPDAPKGTFTHWVVTNIPPRTTSLAAGGPLPPGAIASPNDAGVAGWTGPCPPSGRHHYTFRVLALDVTLARKLSRAQFRSAIEGHVLAQGELVATYERQAIDTHKESK